MSTNKNVYFEYFYSVGKALKKLVCYFRVTKCNQSLKYIYVSIADIFTLFVLMKYLHIFSSVLFHHTIYITKTFSKFWKYFQRSKTAKKSVQLLNVIHSSYLKGEEVIDSKFTTGAKCCTVVKCCTSLFSGIFKMTVLKLGLCQAGAVIRRRWWWC